MREILWGYWIFRANHSWIWISHWKNQFEQTCNICRYRSLISNIYQQTNNLHRNGMQASSTPVYFSIENAEQCNYMFSKHPVEPDSPWNQNNQKLFIVGVVFHGSAIAVIKNNIKSVPDFYWSSFMPSFDWMDGTDLQKDADFVIAITTTFNMFMSNLN